MVLKQKLLKHKTRILNKGDAVFEIDQACTAIYQVISGQVHLYRDDINGNRTILYRAYTGDIFAEASINASQYHCTALCLVRTELIVIERAHFLQLLHTNSEFSAIWINHLSTELRRQRASVARLSLKKAEDKIIHFITTEGNALGELIIRGSLSELAQTIGLSRESLYRTLSKMKNKGTLEQNNKTFILH